MIIKKCFSETTFGDLPVGTIFHLVYGDGNIEEKFYIKTNHHDDWYGYFAVELETGETSYLNSTQIVVPVECELHVKV